MWIALAFGFALWLGVMFGKEMRPMGKPFPQDPHQRMAVALEGIEHNTKGGIGGGGGGNNADVIALLGEQKLTLKRIEDMLIALVSGDQAKVDAFVARLKASADPLKKAVDDNPA